MGDVAVAAETFRRLLDSGKNPGLSLPTFVCARLTEVQWLIEQTLSVYERTMRIPRCALLYVCEGMVCLSHLPLGTPEPKHPWEAPPTHPPPTHTHSTSHLLHLKDLQVTSHLCPSSWAECIHSYRSECEWQLWFFFFCLNSECKMTHKQIRRKCTVRFYLTPPWQHPLAKSFSPDFENLACG